MGRKANKLARATALVLTYSLTAIDAYMFRNAPKQLGEHEFIAATAFRASLLVILWRIKIYPRSLQPQGKYRQFLIEFFISMFLVETLQADFWLTLMESFKGGQILFADTLWQRLQEVNIEGEPYCGWIRSRTVYIIMIYAWANFFLVTCLFAAGYIPVKTSGIVCFIWVFKKLFWTISQMFRKPKKTDPICPITILPIPDNDDDSSCPGFSSDVTICSRTASYTDDTFSDIE